jgi:hypothetical protein
LAGQRKSSYINGTKTKNHETKNFIHHRFILFFTVNAQKKGQKVTAYAITGTEKGHSNWTEVRLVDVSTGEEIQSIYKSASEPTILNARTGKPIVKKDLASSKTSGEVIGFRIPEKADSRDLQPTKREVIVFRDGKDVITNVNANVNANVNTNVNTHINTIVHNNINLEKRIYATYAYSKTSSDKPFSTYSAACAYDKNMRGFIILQWELTSFVI